MNSLLLKYQRIIDKLPLAAKAGGLAAVLSIIFIIWYYSLWQNLHSSITVSSNEIKTLKQSVPDLTQQLQTIESNIKIKQEQRDKNKLNPANSRLLSPHQTNEILYKLLTTANNLTLVQLENVPPKMLFLSQSNLKIFEHGIVIKFFGDYFATMNYLQSIEGLKWKLFWDRLEYKVTKYPAAEITLHIHTISDYEEWIDV